MGQRLIDWRVPVRLSGADPGLALRLEAADVSRATTRCRAEQVRAVVAVGAQATPPPAWRVAAKMTGLGWLRRRRCLFARIGHG
jgi:hypothetical protein